MNAFICFCDRFRMHQAWIESVISLVFLTHFIPSFGSWYKDGEQLLTSIPGYIVIKDRDLRLVANEFNEGTYTCRIHRRGTIVSANSWAIRLKPEQSSNNS